MVTQKAPKIKVTNNYDLFKKIKGNRDIDERNVKSIEKSIKSGLNFLSHNPILVTHEKYVIDGQHRLEVCKRLELPVYYIEVPDIGVYDIAQLNSNSKKWSPMDYINCYCELGNENYLKLRFYVVKYNMPISFTASLLMHSHSGNKNGSTAKIVREGKFEFKSSEQFDLVYSIASIFPINKIPRTTQFLTAIGKISKSENLSIEELRSKVQTHSHKIEPRHSWQEYCKMIEDVYNYRRHGEYVRLF